MPTSPLRNTFTDIAAKIDAGHDVTEFASQLFHLADAATLKVEAQAQADFLDPTKTDIAALL